MSLRESLSLPAILHDVVTPCLRELLRPGELTSVDLAWRTVERPDWPAERPRSPGLTITSGPLQMVEEIRLVLTLTFAGETFRFDVATESHESAANDTLDDVRECLFSALQDFIAESHFGWGEQRP